MIIKKCLMLICAMHASGEQIVKKPGLNADIFKNVVKFLPRYTLATTGNVHPEYRKIAVDELIERNDMKLFPSISLSYDDKQILRDMLRTICILMKYNTRNRILLMLMDKGYHVILNEIRYKFDNDDTTESTKDERDALFLEPTKQETIDIIAKMNITEKLAYDMMNAFFKRIKAVQAAKYKNLRAYRAKSHIESFNEAFDNGEVLCLTLQDLLKSNSADYQSYRAYAHIESYYNEKPHNLESQGINDFGKWLLVILHARHQTRVPLPEYADRHITDVCLYIPNNPETIALLQSHIEILRSMLVNLIHFYEVRIVLDAANDGMLNNILQLLHTICGPQLKLHIRGKNIDAEARLFCLLTESLDLSRCEFAETWSILPEDILTHNKLRASTNTTCSAVIFPSNLVFKWPNDMNRNTVSAFMMQPDYTNFCDLQKS